MDAVILSETGDEVSRAALWLFFTLRRMGNTLEASQVLAVADPALAEGNEQPDIQLILAYKGLLPSDSIQARATGRDQGDRAMYSYAIGYFLSLRPDQQAEAAAWFEHARTSGNWASLPYLAAEADLARMRKAPRP